MGTTGTTRLGPEPSLNTKQEVLRRIQYKLDRNDPFEVSCAWGAIKTVSSDIKSVDFAELLTFSQYAAINRQIKSVYEPGVRFNLYMGDDYYEYLYGLNPEIKDYCKGMCELAKDYEEVNPIYISESVYKIPNVKEVREKNYELLKEYWNDTEGLEEKQFCTLSSYRCLEEITPENMVKNSAPLWTVVGAVSVNRDGNTHIRLVDSSVYSKVKMEYSEYKGIPFGIISEEEFLDALK